MYNYQQTYSPMKKSNLTKTISQSTKSANKHTNTSLNEFDARIKTQV